MSFFKKVLFLLLCILSLSTYAQIKEDSILQLEEVVIDVNRLRFTTGDRLQIIDSATIQNYSSNNLGDLLSQQAQVFIKSYGPGNLSTISIRGTNAYHTPVLWNGFNLQGPTLGQTDFSLFPVSFAEDIEIQYGGAGALYGSGAVGGVIHMNNPAKFDKGIQASISSDFGSFSNYYQAVNFKISKERFISSVKFFNSTAKNNFPFINTTLPGSPKVRQSNAEVKQIGLLFENFYKIRDDQQINLRLWLQGNDRQVPPIMTNPTILTSVGSDFYRISSEWKKTGEVATYFIRTAFFNDLMNYRDPSTTVNNSKTHIKTSITEIESNIFLSKNQLLNVGINNTYNQATSSGGYPDGVDQNRMALFASYKLKNLKDTWKGTASLRQEMIQGEFIPFTPSVGFEGLLFKGVSLKGNVSRNYRVPTFNDLYWKPGGNPDLKPESGWSEELTIIAQPQLKSLSNNSISCTLFNSNVNNWIMWMPYSSSWSVFNIQSVWARGLETNLKTSLKIGQLKIDLSLLYNYVVSTNEKAKTINDDSYKKQLIYVPIYNGQGHVSLSYRNFYLNYVHTYTGNRFTSSDNTEYLKSYQLGNVFLGKNFILKYTRVNLHIRINNIWNQSYQTVMWQAMPMRYYQAGLSIFFNKPNKL